MVAKRPLARLDFVDGIRALAALYVVLFHIQNEAGVNTRTLPLALRLLLSWTRFGHVPVDVFIVVSGYCLMLPVARSADGVLRGGFWGYLKRRARRILPPYYVALVLSLLIGGIANAANYHPTGVRDGILGVDKRDLLLHLVMLHDFSKAWSMSINGSMWSVAVEWHIYFLFPLLLLPVWRRWGGYAAVAAGFVLGYLPHFVLPHGYNLDWSYPWYVGLFALGMVAACSDFSRRALDEGWKRIPWGPLGVVCAVLALAVLVLGRMKFGNADLGIIYDPIAGIAAMSLLAWCGRRLTSGEPEGALLTLLQSRWLVLLGHFSYSVYLMHRPLLFLVAWGADILHLSHTATVLMLIASLPVVLGASYLFFLAFERPFLSTAAKKAT